MRTFSRRRFLARSAQAGALALAAPAAVLAAPYRSSAQSLTVAVQLMSDHETNSWRGIIDQYNRLNKANVQLVVLGRTGFYEKLQTELMGKSRTPDIVQFASNLTAPYAAAGFLAPLSEYLADASATPKDFDFEDFVPGARETVTYNKQVYGFPDDLSVYLLYYRTDLISTPPQTWTEYYDVARRFTQSQNPKSPTRYGTTIQGAQGSLPPKEWSQTFWSYGGTIFNGKGDSSLASDAGIRALTERMEMLRVWKCVPADAINYSYPETSTAFQEGLVAMAVQWNAAYSDFLSKEKSPKVYDRVKAAGVPGGVPFVQTQVWSINANSPNKRAAYDFLLWTRAKAQDLAYALGTGGEPGNPTRASTLRNPEVLAKRPELKGLADAIKKGRTFPMIAPWAKVQGEMDKAIALGTTGQMTPTAALKAADAAITQIVRS